MFEGVSGEVVYKIISKNERQSAGNTDVGTAATTRIYSHVVGTLEESLGYLVLPLV